jgi:hypothetical protein
LTVVHMSKSKVLFVLDSVSMANIWAGAKL